MAQPARVPVEGMRILLALIYISQIFVLFIVHNSALGLALFFQDLMESFGTRVQKGRMADSPKGASEVAKWIKAANPKAELILKSQIHAGGRGKGVFDSGFKGGVKICETPQEVETLAAKMIGHRLITKQTGPNGTISLLSVCAAVLSSQCFPMWQLCRPARCESSCK